MNAFFQRTESNAHFNEGLPTDVELNTQIFINVNYF